MDRIETLAAGAGGVVVVALLVALLAPGALSGPPAERDPGRVDIADATIQPQDIGGQTVDLRVNTTLRHRGNPSRDVSVRLQAIDAESGLLATTQTVSVGELRGERERIVPATLSVDREGGYRIETVVYQDGRRVDTGRQQVSGLQALVPAYARTPITFADERTLPPLGVAVREASGDRTTLDATALLTNQGSTQPANVSVQLTVRQADSNLVADRASADVAAIRPGRTAETTMTVSVPSEYNYYIDGVLRKDGVIVDTTRTAVNLDPSERLAVNETSRDVALEVSDFERDRPTAGADDGAEMEGDSGSATPGFGVPVAALALALGGLFARRRLS